MILRTLLALCAAAGFLSACETYTEKTSPCFGRNGEPQVTRSVLSFATMSGPVQNTAKADCTFEPMPRPE